MTSGFHKWLPAPMEIEVVDVWPPGTLTEEARDAYDRLCRDGRIISRGATKDRSGRVVVRYMADIPAQWIHEELREAKYAGKQIGLSEVKRD